MAIGGLASFFERTLIGKERLRLHEEQRKGRQTNIRYRIAAFALPLVGKGRAHIRQAAQKMVENQHLNLESEPSTKRNQNLQTNQAI